MDFVQTAWSGQVVGAVFLFAALAGVTLPAGAAGPKGTSGIAPGLHRRLDGVGFVSPQEDDFFADYKDLVTPPKDLLETPKGLLETPKDLTETPEDLVDTPKDLAEAPKDLLDEQQNEDFEEYAQGKKGPDEVGEADNDDTVSHDDLAELSLAKHLKNSERTPSGTPTFDEDPAIPETSSFSQGSPSGRTQPSRTPPNLLRSPYDQAGFRSPYDHADVRALYDQSAKSAPRPPASGGYHGHPSALRDGFSGNLGHGGSRQHQDDKAVRPEYAYRYGVHDPLTKDVKSAWEQRDGEDTRGGYALVEPNGHTRVVEYQVTKNGGFNARVKHLPPGHRGR